jgi:two-component system, NtrC family, response regulator
MLKGNILIIDDEEKLRGLLARIISLEGYTVLEAPNAKAGLNILDHEDIHVVICDVRLPDANGIELTNKIKKLAPLAEVIILTAFGTIQDGVNAIKSGAFDYISKGDDNDKILPLIEKAIDKSLLQKRVHALEQKVEDKFGFENILGISRTIRDTIDLAKKVAVTDATVLLLGETGTGKEVFAQAIHQASSRKLRPFVAVNCSAFGKDILESEIFGHKAGAFTGAVKDKKGLFDEANFGTIFLDEIGEMSLDLQSKLLRVIESNSFIKVGDTKVTNVNVRIIAATNRDLQKECEHGNFRLDLFYRLSGFQVKLPALRDRKEDIPEIANYYIKFFSNKVNKKVLGMEPAFVKQLLNHSWKGNIRELKNVIERAVILTDSDLLTLQTLPYEFETDFIIFNDESGFSLSGIEKKHIIKVLSYTNGNKPETAKLLGIGLTTLYRKMQEYLIA